MKIFSRNNWQSLMVVAFVITLSLSACRSHQPLVGPSSPTTSTTQQQLTYNDAVDWAKHHVSTLISDYQAKYGNKLDPDEMRKGFAPIGYDGSNVALYRDAERWLVDTLYSVMLKDAVSKGNHSIIIMTGTGAAGKSTATKNMDYSQTGLLYDAAFNSYRKLSAAIDKARKAGMNDVTVIAVYNDIMTCYKNSYERGKVTKRFLYLDYLVGAFRGNIGKYEKLNQNYPDINLIAVDNSGNNGGRRVSREETEKWEFHVTPDDLHRLLTFLYDKIEQGDISGWQIASAAGDVLSIEGIADADKKMAEEIARRAREASK